MIGIGPMVIDCPSLTVVFAPVKSRESTYPDGTVKLVPASFGVQTHNAGVTPSDSVKLQV